MTSRSPILRRSRRLFALAAPGLLGGCNMVVMNPTGDIAMQERNLILIALAMMLLVIIPVMALTIIFAWRYRKGRAPETYDPTFDHSTRIEVVVWSIPLLIIFCLGVITWITTHTLDPFRPLDRIAPGRPIPPGTEPLDIQVVAMDWKWLFIYPKQGIATVNELDLPVDVPVRFSITSTSQMNTFYAPTLAGMIYAMPGMQSMLHAVLNKPGDSWGYSGNYTGRGFSDMRFQLHGVDRAGFDRWVAQVKASPNALSTGSYLTLEKPSEKAPVMHFSSVSTNLFYQALNRCVAPGSVCTADIMRKDRALDADHGGPFAIDGAPSSPATMSMGAPTNATPAAAVTPEQRDAGLPARGPAKPGTTTAISLPVPGAPRAARI
ncbi:ubiquinol oxidase subunit II [Sphingomonas abietis]|uniref:Ubiquinol oxidase polypeptide II n=1 Tax=Sphingomonas abietis TaxID=3012344 RepID=A0ABY7NMT8_9SPHN|nr:ubiquinol oxidase subunit II [Sphingomonas abietis]WBO22841.1 ubiquinol oxidase subunit II [Sphingomonas abietis]